MDKPCDRGDREHDRREHGTHGVGQRGPASVPLPMPAPLHNHAASGQREDEEDPDCVQRDQRVSLAVESDEYGSRDDGKGCDAVTERQPVAHPQERARDVGVTGENAVSGSGPTIGEEVSRPGLGPIGGELRRRLHLGQVQVRSTID